MATGGGSVRIVSPEEEGRLAYTGAVSRADVHDGVIAVCDVGGRHSDEIVVGMPLVGPAWVRSVNVGSLRLTLALLQGDPPPPGRIGAAREAIREAFASIRPPRPELALATGGSARAIARVVGGPYGEPELEQLVQSLASRPADSVRPRSSGSHRTGQGRCWPARSCCRRSPRLLGTTFTPARGGIREGAALRLAALERAA